jgi:DNA-binding IclR family transcriptional regulator
METKSVQTLERALDIIELLAIARPSLGVTSIGSRLSLHKSTVHRLLKALEGRGYVEKDAEGRYSLGLKLLELSSQRLNQLELKTEASPILRSLAARVQTAVHLAILRGSDAVYIEKIEPVSNIRMYSQIGKRIPAYCSALGKVLCADKGEAELAAMADGFAFESFTPNTIDNPSAFILEVARMRERGYAIDDEEHEAGIRCIAAPIRDYTGRIIAALSVSGPSELVRRDRDDEIGAMALEAALEISLRMGYGGPAHARRGA